MPLIEIRDVEKSYTSRTGSEFCAVRGFDLEIAEGEFFCLLGPSGCGKTTILSMLAGFEQPTAGTIAVAGVPVRGPSRDRGVVFQGDDSLYNWLPAIANIEFGLRLRGLPRAERRDTAMRFLELVGLAGQQDKFPSELSGGMKQRIQIARALVCDAPVLLMDEPFGALDAQTRTILQDELVSICSGSGATVLFITHDIAEAIILADRIGVMRAGPGSAIKDEFALDLPRPRNRGSVEFAAAYDRIQRVLGEEVKKVVSRETAA